MTKYVVYSVAEQTDQTPGIVARRSIPQTTQGQAVDLLATNDPTAAVMRSSDSPLSHAKHRSRSRTHRK